jgi:YVTN family beta-propeller protein
MSSRRLVKSAVVVAVALGAGFGVHKGAYTHVRYYSGTEPRTLNCYTCHVRGSGGGPLDRFAPPPYQSPMNVAITPDDRTLVVTAQDGNAVLLVDLATQQVTDRIPVGTRPNGVVITADGATAFVSSERGDTVSAIDVPGRRLRTTFAGGAEPSGLALSSDGRALFVANRGTDQVLVLDPQTGHELGRFAAGSAPGQMAVGAGGARLVVTNELSNLGPKGEQPRSEVTVVDAVARRVVSRPMLRNAHLSEGVVIAPEGDIALVALMQPKNLVPIIQVGRGWVMTNGLGVIDLRSGRVVQLLLDEPAKFYADPYGIALTPDGRHALVSHSGTDTVSVIDMARLRGVIAAADPADDELTARDLSLSQRFVVARVPTGPNPKGITISHDGRRAYVAERLGDSVLVLDAHTWQPAGRIVVGEVARETVLRRGERLFNSAGRTFEGQFSCRSCHPNDHVDRLQYDFEPDGLGKDIVDNRSLLGIAGTGPFKWSGKNTSMFMQCGIRFARILTRLEALPPDDLAALVAFMRSLTPVRNPYRSANGTLSPSQQHGKEIYERAVMKDGTPIPENNRCITCHSGPHFTNRKLADVGTKSDDSPITAFDTPHLTNVYGSAPYLHDGRARTLEEIWTVYNPDDKHGITRDMSKRDLNDLIEYLKTL